jgi:RHS repeat-associated protein
VRRARQLPAALVVVLVPLAATHSNARAPKLLASRGACPTYIEITQAPTRYYYQSTANISVAWGELDTGEWPPCLTGGDGPDPNTFRFTVDGVNRTSDFVVGSDGATATNFSLPNGVDIKLIATIVGYDEEFNTVTNADTVITSVNAGATQDSSFVDNQSVNPPDSVVERDLCLTIAAGSAAAFECGDLRIVHPLPTVRTLGRERAPTLIYNSDHSNPFPLVAANVTLPSTAQVPDSVVARLLVSGVQRATAKWAGSQWIWGQTRRIVIGFNGLGDATGVYPYTLELRNWYGSSAKSRTVTGTLAVVNRAASAFGAGWWLAGLEQLNTSTMTWVGGDGSLRVYRPAGTNVWVARNVDRPDTLKWVSPYYIRYLPHGVQVRFNSAGQHALTRDRLGHETRFFHGTSGLLDSIVIPPGSSFTYRFTYSSGKLASIIAPGSRTTTVSMNSGRISSIRDPDNTTVSFGFNGTQTNRVASRTDRRGIATTFNYDQSLWKLTWNFLSMQPDADIQIVFDPLEIKGRAAAGSIDTALAYTSLNGPRSDVGDSTLIWLDRYGAPRRIRDPLGNVTEVSRTDGIWPAAVTRIKYPNGRVVRATYNMLGLVSSVTDSSFCQGGSCARTTYSYDTNWGFVSVVIPPMLDTMFFGYDATNGNRVWQQDARGVSSRIEFRYYTADSIKGRVRAIDPPLSPPDSFEYDFRGNLRRTVTPLGYTTTYENNTLGFTWRVTPDSAIGQTTTYWDTLSGRDTLTKVSGPLNQVQGDLLYPGGVVTWPAAAVYVRRRYDPEGNLVSTRRYGSPVLDTLRDSTVYDRANRPRVAIATDGRRDSTIYDAAGNATAVITRRQHRIDQLFDAANRLTQRRVPGVSYPAETFRGVSYTSASIPGDTTQFYYDAMGRDTLAVNRYARTRRTYAPNGLLLQEEQRIRNATDLNRSVWDTTGFGHTYVLGYGYDLNGRRTALRHPTQLGPGSDTTRYSYNSFGALASIVDPYGSFFRFFYDAESRLDSLAFADTVGEKRWYDPDGRLLYRRVASENRSGCPTVTGSESCYPDNFVRYDSIVYWYGRVLVAKNAGRERYYFDYTGLGQVGRAIRGYYRTRHVDSTWHWSSWEDFWPDGFGNMIWRWWTTGTADAPRDTFAYDRATGRLSQQATLYGGNWIWEPSVHDSSGSNHATSRFRYGSQCVMNDALVCSESEPIFYQDVTMQWYDAEHRLRIVIHDARVDNPFRHQADGFEKYWYDAYGRRIQRRWDSECYYDFGSCREDAHLERYVWDGSQILYEIRAEDVAGQQDDDLRSTQEFGRVGYVHGPGIDNPLEAFRADGGLEHNRLLLHADWRGTITLGSWEDGSQDRLDPVTGAPSMVDWGSQNVLTFGERRSRFTNTNLRFFGSLLSRQVDNSHLQYLRNRYYDPITGRFTQEDPIGIAGGLNLYGFANGDPVNYSDPFGLCPPCLPGLDVAVGIQVAAQAIAMDREERANTIRREVLGFVGDVVTFGAVGKVLSGALGGLSRSSAAAEGVLRPRGELIGRAGSGVGVREVTGGVGEARALFGRLAAGAEVRPHPRVQGGLIADLPGGGTVGFRPSSRSGSPTVDVNLPGLDDVKKVKFVGPE